MAEDSSPLLARSLPPENFMSGHKSSLNDRLLMSVDTRTLGENMSYFSEGELSFIGSQESISSLPASRAQAYGAMALSPTGSDTHVTLSEFDAFPVNVTCTHCKEQVNTTVRYRCGKVAIISSVLLGLLCFGVGCFVPCFAKSLKDASHECPKCGTLLGVYRRKMSCVS
ncbi:cell death-inducing p53-target protein 1-like isoform X2 [Halichondria panicea]